VAGRQSEYVGGNGRRGKGAASLASLSAAYPTAVIKFLMVRGTIMSWQRAA